ncbi:MAG: metallophosphoesterase, partial [Candidatus Saccharimonadales bacterium]|nr:metallophosphoesterase [Candidatus Saccharimonadales bacterium]
AWCKFVKDIVGETFPVQLVAGNHDVAPEYMASQGDISRFSACLPNRMPDMEGTYGDQYSFEYNDLAKFIFLSPDLEIHDKYYRYDKGPDREWLESQVEDAKKKGLWTITVMHKNCVTIGKKDCEITTAMQDYLVDAGVDLILQGHEHAYMRSAQLQLSDKCPTINVEKGDKDCIKDNQSDSEFTAGGSVIVINGMGGRDMYYLDKDRPEATYLVSWYGDNIENSEFGPSVFTVDENSIKAKMVSITGEVKDSFTITR